MGFASFGAGDTIFNQGETGEHFYIILSGAVAVSVYLDEETKVRQLQSRLCSGVTHQDNLCGMYSEAQALHSC